MHPLDARRILAHRTEAEPRAECHGRDRDRRKGAERQQHAGSGEAHRGERRRTADEPGACRPQVGDERHMGVSRLQRNDRRGDDLGAVEHERPLAGAECGGGAADRRLEPADGLPGDASRLAALDAEQLVLFHVADERGFEPLDIALQDALRHRGRRAGHAVQQARWIGHGDAGAFFEDRLLQVALGDPDFLAEREDLVGREMRPLVLRCLQLGCALEDPLERGAIDPGRGAARHATSSPPVLGLRAPAPRCGIAAASGPARAVRPTSWPGRSRERAACARPNRRRRWPPCP